MNPMRSMSRATVQIIRVELLLCEDFVDGEKLTRFGVAPFVVDVVLFFGDVVRPSVYRRSAERVVTPILSLPLLRLLLSAKRGSLELGPSFLLQSQNIVEFLLRSIRRNGWRLKKLLKNLFTTSWQKLN